MEDEDPTTTNAETELLAHLARMLTGTGMDAADALAVAAGDEPTPTPTRRALRAGWTSPDLVEVRS